MMNRRQFVVLSLGAAATGAEAQLTPNIAALRKAALDEAIRKVVGGAQVRPGRVKLDLPPLIENGNSVPLTVTVDSAMTEAVFFWEVPASTEKNPQPNVLAAQLGPRAGRARI